LEDKEQDIMKKTNFLLGVGSTVALLAAPMIISGCSSAPEAKADGGAMSAPADQKAGEGKCGEGKCGEGKCGDKGAEHKAEGEGKCGEGKCGDKGAEGGAPEGDAPAPQN
jgi:uncharacterized low-complexity protein